jgi:hypothetical protein
MYKYYILTCTYQAQFEKPFDLETGMRAMVVYLRPPYNSQNLIKVIMLRSFVPARRAAGLAVVRNNFLIAPEFYANRLHLHQMIRWLNSRTAAFLALFRR